MDISALRVILNHSNFKAVLAMIREGETCQREDAYGWLFGSTQSRPRLFSDFSKHPNFHTYEKWDGQFIKNGKIDYTTAAGAYQITRTTFDALVKRYRFPDFSPETQDLMAIALIIEKQGAFVDILEGDIREAIVKLRPIWASLPGATFGQPTQHLEAALAVYCDAGGALGIDGDSNTA